MPYIFRHTDTPLWKAFTARVKREGRTLRAVLEALMTRYVERGLDDDH